MRSERAIDFLPGEFWACDSSAAQRDGTSRGEQTMAAEPVALADEHRAFVDHLVAKGDFPSAEAVVAQAIALLLEDETEWQVFLDRINEGHNQVTAVPLADKAEVPVMAVRHAYRRARRILLARRNIQDRLDALDASEDTG